MADARPIDMRPAAITARLREMALRQQARGFIVKGVDMTASAVTQRLRAMAALTTMCQRLTSVGTRLRPVSPREG